MRILQADLDEIVFRSRNRAYGAYQLRKHSGKTTLLAFLLGSLAIAGLLALPVLHHLISEADLPATLVETDAEVQLAPSPVREPEDAPKELNVPPPPPPARAQIKFIPPEIVKNEEAPAPVSIPSQDTLLADPGGIGGGTHPGEPGGDGGIFPGLPGGTGTGAAEPGIQVLPPSDVFVPVDKQPQAANMDDIRKRMVYPEIARQGSIEGRVILKVLIDEEGTPLQHI
ncbi:MAG: hypothetical protein ACK5P1_12300, partial [Sphingobacteriia bacterium]